MKRVLLTGIGGSIGCHVLIHLLHNTDWEVVGLDSFRHKGMTDRVSQMMGYHPEYQSRLTLFQHDLTAPISSVLVKKLGVVDTILNLASLSDVQDSIANPVPFVVNNVQLMLNVLEYARVAKPAVLLHVSTDEVYGPTDGKHVHQEWSSSLPSNPYSASKVAQEALCVSYWRSYGVPLMLVNLMNNFGEMQSPAKFPSIVQRKVRKGEEVEIHTDHGLVGSRHYMHSRNNADAMLFLLKMVPVKLHQATSLDRPERFNIVGEKQIDNLSLAQLIADFIGKLLRYRLVPSAASRPGHDIHYGLDGSKLAALGWKPPVPFEESMKNTVAWYEANPEWLFEEAP